MTAHPEVPACLAPLLDDLEAIPGVRAVVLGGSRALGREDGGSDWDIGVYYQGPIDLRALGRWGEFHPPGAWGRIMNGGAWLLIDRLKVDVLLRDVDVVDRWADSARRGHFEIDLLLGYLAGRPTASSPSGAWPASCEALSRTPVSSPSGSRRLLSSDGAFTGASPSSKRGAAQSAPISLAPSVRSPRQRSKKPTRV